MLYLLAWGLGQMPIKRLTVQDNFRDHDKSHIHAIDHSWYDEMCERRFPTFLPSSWDESIFPVIWDRHTPNVLTWDCRGIAHLFHAFSIHCHKLDKLHFGTQRSLSPMVLFQPSSGIVDRIDRLAPRLRCLKIDCKPYVSDKKQDVDVAASCLTNFMQNAKELRALSLSSSKEFVEHHAREILQGCRVWPHLSLLDLGSVKMLQDWLAAIIGAQKDTCLKIDSHCR